MRRKDVRATLARTPFDLNGDAPTFLEDALELIRRKGGTAADMAAFVHDWSTMPTAITALRKWFRCTGTGLPADRKVFNGKSRAEFERRVAAYRAELSGAGRPATTTFVPTSATPPTLVDLTVGAPPPETPSKQWREAMAVVAKRERKPKRVPMVSKRDMES